MGVCQGQIVSNLTCLQVPVAAAAYLGVSSTSALRQGEVGRLWAVMDPSPAGSRSGSGGNQKTSKSSFLLVTDDGGCASNTRLLDLETVSLAPRRAAAAPEIPSGRGAVTAGLSWHSDEYEVQWLVSETQQGEGNDIPAGRFISPRVVQGDPQSVASSVLQLIQGLSRPLAEEVDEAPALLWRSTCPSDSESPGITRGRKHMASGVCFCRMV